MNETLLINESYNKDNDCEVCLNMYLCGNRVGCRCWDAKEECTFVKDDILTLLQIRKFKED